MKRKASVKNLETLTKAILKTSESCSMTKFPTEPTEEDLHRRFMIVEDENGQPKMVEVFFEKTEDDGNDRDDNEKH